MKKVIVDGKLQFCHEAIGINFTFIKCWGETRGL